MLQYDTNSILFHTCVPNIYLTLFSMFTLMNTRMIPPYIVLYSALQGEVYVHMSV
jgi:hypothetical protein